MLYVGLDVHKRYVLAVAVNEAGVTQSEARLDNEKEALEQYIGSLPDAAKVALEATYGWSYVYDALEDHANDIVLSHPKKTKAVASAKIKTDRIDATVLAQLLRMDYLPTSYAAPRKVRDLRDLLRHRATLVRVRTAAKNRIHSVLARYGIRHPFSDLFGKAGRAFLSQLDLRPFHRLVVEDNLLLIDTVNESVKRASKQIRLLSRQDERVEWLESMPGVGYYSALLILAEIGDVARFPTAKQLCSYAGLVPSVHASGDHARYGRITKEGSSWLRWIMVEAAHQATRKAGRLRRFYERVARKHGRKPARVALARQMLSIIHHLLTRRKRYEDPTATSRA
jgi:transposase